MKTIDEVLEEFLDEQKKRLKPRTFNDYDSVLELFRLYLNGYAYQYLPEELYDEFIDHHAEDDEYFTKTYGLDQLSDMMFDEFFEYFIIRKVASGESFMKNAIRVIKKFTKWLKETNHISKNRYEMLIGYFDEDKSTLLSNAEKAADLIYDLAKESPDKEYDDILDDYFTIGEIEPKKIWLESMFGTESNIGPVIVTKQISDLLAVGSEISLVIGKKNNQWTILESGNVYP